MSEGHAPKRGRSTMTDEGYGEPDAAVEIEIAGGSDGDGEVESNQPYNAGGD